MFYIGHDTYAKLWRIEEKKNKSNDNTRLVGSISTSESDQDGSKIFSCWNCIFVGEARKVAKDFNEGDNIVIKKCKITNHGFKKTDGSYDNYLEVTIFDVAPSDYEKKRDENAAEDDSSKKKTTKSNTSTKSKKKDEDEIEDDDLPF